MVIILYKRHKKCFVNIGFSRYSGNWFWWFFVKNSSSLIKIRETFSQYPLVYSVAPHSSVVSVLLLQPKSYISNIPLTPVLIGRDGGVGVPCSRYKFDFQQKVLKCLYYILCLYATISTSLFIIGRDQHWVTGKKITSFTQCSIYHSGITWSLVTSSGAKTLLSPLGLVVPADPGPTLRKSEGGRLTHLMLIAVLLQIQFQWQFLITYSGLWLV